MLNITRCDVILHQISGQRAVLGQRRKSESWHVAQSSTNQFINQLEVYDSIYDRKMYSDGWAAIPRKWIPPDILVVERSECLGDEVLEWGGFFFALPLSTGITVVTTPGSPGTASTRLDHSDSRLAPWHRYSGYKYETVF